MTDRRPADTGMSLAEIDTPALLLDLDAFDRNVARMARAAADAGLALRPHAKTHKSPVIAQRQMAAGAVGVCCQTVNEAEALVQGGVGDVHLSNVMAGRRKAERLVALTRLARVSCCADSDHGVAELAQAACAVGVILPVLVEVDVGHGRCGVPPGEPAAELAARVADTEGVRFAGLQAYHGGAQHIRDHQARQDAIGQAANAVRRSLAALDRRSLSCPIVTGGGTGTFPFEAASGVFTELQPGSYIFMDADYARNRDETGGPFQAFEHSLFLWATVISTRPGERALLDVGHKAHGGDSGPFVVADHPNLIVQPAGDEHGTLVLGPDTPSFPVGTKLRLIPGHCDPTVNLYDWYVCLRNGQVAALWPVAARGPGP